MIGRPAPPWLFGLMIVPSGLFTGTLTVVFPYLAAHHGMSLAAIGSVVGAGMLASPMKLLWTPLVDLAWTLRGWVAASAAITALLVAALLIGEAGHRSAGLLAGLAFAAGTAVAFCSIGTCGLLALASDEAKLGAASGCLQGGQLVAQGLGGALGLWLASQISIGAAAAVIASCTLASSLAVLLIAEPERPHLLATIPGRVASIARDIWSMARNRRRAFVIVLFLTPIGVGAASNLFSGIAGEWHAGAGTVALVTGLGSACASAAGAFVYGRFADRFDRILSLFVIGLLLAAAAILLAVLPRTPLSFAAGALIYALCLGCAYTSFAALMFETIGKGAAASKYCALNAVGNVPVSYMPVVLGLVHDRWSTDTMLWFEAACTTAFVLAFALAGRAIAAPGAAAGPVAALGAA